ncbi:MAG: FKBP-type peptidyl-prolyl cis-trans isomerase [Candidatus Dormiibacterota bacterium]
MASPSGALRMRFVPIAVTVAFAALALGGCGSLVTVSSQITPPPPTCSTARPVAAVDSFSTPVTLQPGDQGLQFGDITVGCGAAAGAASSVNVQFTVWLSDGTQVVTTRGAGSTPNALQLSDTSTLAFWRVGMPGMRVGGTRRLVVPPALAFGAAGNSSAHVPPNATLIVDVELVSLS